MKSLVGCRLTVTAPDRPWTDPSTRRVAVVTGGSRGIGKAIAKGLAEDGAAVVFTYRKDAQAAADTVKEIEQAGGEAAALQASLNEREDVDRIAAQALEKHGYVDTLVLSAGSASRGNPVAETDRDEVERLFFTHAAAAHQLIRLLLPSMRSRQRSDVVVVSSTEVTKMRANGAPYNMAKSALEALALTLAQEEVANGVHVNIVAPGLVATDMGDRLVRAKLGLEGAHSLDAAQPLGRVCRPEDVARVVRFLVSDQAGLVIGQRIAIDGGSDASPTGAD